MATHNLISQYQVHIHIQASVLFVVPGLVIFLLRVVVIVLLRFFSGQGLVLSHIWAVALSTLHCTCQSGSILPFAYQSTVPVILFLFETH
ncbi:hypothetical protein B0H13DRAFT_2068988, partial [Mycena leptocephala]